MDALRSRDTIFGGSTGNYGMQDQRSVLEWVKSSIANFGGDPSRVTIFGESSGGSSVGFHLTSKRSYGAGLFQQAIMQSPGLTQSKTWNQSTSNTEMAVSVLTGAGSPGCSWGDRTDSSSRDLDADDQEWIVFPSEQISDYHVVTYGTTATVAAGRKLCNSIDGCVGLNVHPNGTSVLRGCGRAGNLTKQIFIVHPGYEDGYSVQLKRADPKFAQQCLVQADKYDLVAIDIGPPFDDSFYTDAAAPTEDGVELSESLQSRARTSIPPNVNILGGSNLDEGTEFMYLTPRIKCNANASVLNAWTIEQFGPSLGAKVPTVFGKVQQPTPVCRNGGSGPAVKGSTNEYMVAMRSAGDAAITCRIRDVLIKTQGSGGNGWWYQFTATPISSLNMGDLPASGAFHGAEVPFVFGYPPEITSPAEHKLSRSMGCFWTNFAASGNPNTGPDGCVAELGLPAWPSVGATGDAMRFANDTIAVAVKSLKKQECDLFAEYP